MNPVTHHEPIPYTEFTDLEITQLVKKNATSYFHYRSYEYPNALYINPQYTKIETGIDVPIWNCIIGTSLKENAEETITNLRDSFLHKGYKGMGWMVYPYDKPENLEDLLIKHGFNKMFEYYLMSSNIDDLEEAPYPRFNLKPVKHETEMKTYFDIWNTVYAFMGSVSDDLYTIESLRGFDEDSPRQNYIGFVDGLPVSVSTLYFDGDTAGVYSVSTLPDVDDRFEIDVTTGRATLLMAKDWGYKVGIAFTSDGGLKYYHRYGFKKHGELQFSGYVYEKN